MVGTNAVNVGTEPSGPVVELRVRAEPSQLSVVRAVAGTIAAQSDFDLDTIADIRLAIDEACSYLVTSAQPESLLSCQFRTLPTGLGVAVSAPTAAGEMSLRHSFGWHVLNTLTDWIDMSQNGDGERPGGTVTTIEFRKSRDDAPT